MEGKMCADYVANCLIAIAVSQHCSIHGLDARPQDGLYIDENL